MNRSPPECAGMSKAQHNTDNMENENRIASQNLRRKSSSNNIQKKTTPQLKKQKSLKAKKVKMDRSKSKLDISCQLSKCESVSSLASEGSYHPDKSQQSNRKSESGRSVYLISADEDLETDLDITDDDRMLVSGSEVLLGDGEENKHRGKFAKIVKTISNIRPIMKKDIIDVNGLIYQPAPVVNGMGTFGIGKMGVHRAVVQFINPPTRRPLTVAFHFATAALSHKLVLDAAKRKLQFVNGGRVEHIQYVDRNIRHGAQGLEVRWLVTVNCSEARDELLRTGLHLFNRRVATRLLDDIQMDEFVEYRSYVGVQKRLFSRINDINMANKLPSALALTISKQPVNDDAAEMEKQIKSKIARQLDGLSMDMMKRRLADIEKQHSKFFDQIEHLRRDNTQDNLIHGESKAD